MGGSTHKAINANGEREKQSDCSKDMVARRGIGMRRIVCVLPPKDKVLEGSSGFFFFFLLLLARSSFLQLFSRA
jgi:hypothetical protein